MFERILIFLINTQNKISYTLVNAQYYTLFIFNLNKECFHYFYLDNNT